MTVGIGHNGFPTGSHEFEQAERFPVKPLEQPLVPLGNFGIYSSQAGEINPNTYARHEGLLRVGDKITLDTQGMRDTLARSGCQEGFAAVPFTGASSRDRIADRRFVDAEREMVAIVVAQERGIKTPDWDTMTPEEKREFAQTGSDYVEMGTFKLFANRGLEVPMAEDEEVGEVLNQVGTYAVTEAAAGDSLVSVITVVDALGRKTVTGADPHALKLLESLGYQKKDTPPFAFGAIPQTDAGRQFINRSSGNLADTSWNIPIRRAA